MNWRPEGWVNDFKNNPLVTHIDPELAYEAGADAMLEGLIKEGIIELVDGQVRMSCPPGCMGMA